MKIWTITDLHLWDMTYGDRIKPPVADVCVVAGDVCDDIESTMAWLGRVIRPHMPCMYVLGNHDFFGTTVGKAKATARKLAEENRIILLDDTMVIGGGVRFVGGTLWTDFELFAAKMQGDLEVTRRRRAREMAMQYAVENMPEYQVAWVNGSETLRRLAPQDTHAMHMATKQFLQQQLATPFNGPTVVVSHHCPHPNSLKDVFEGGKLNPAFGSDLSDIIELHQPALWIHGHTHSSFDYEIGRTRVVCNPRGNNRGNPAFDLKKVVEVTA